MPSSRTKTNGKHKPNKYQPLPDLPPDEFESLKADIAINGLQYPVIQDEIGATLDGHQRERALLELGVKNYPIKVLAGLTEAEKWRYAISVNVKRRHLTTKQKRDLVAQELKRNPKMSNNWLADLLGVDRKTVLNIRQRLESTREIPKLKKLGGKDGRLRVTKYRSVIANTPAELKDAQRLISRLPTNGRTMDIFTARRRARGAALQQQIADEIAEPSPRSAIRLYHCSFQELQQRAKIRNGSVGLIVTDVPYGKEFLSHLSELSAFAKKVLKPGGLFVSYSGQFHLPEVLTRLGEHLTYRWTLASVWDGDGNRIHPLQILSKWKPILVFSRSKWTKRGRWTDVSHSDNKQKNLHAWQQDEIEADMLIRYFSKKGDLVVDPCCGSGTTAVAARRLGRKYIGCDVDAACVAKAQSRLRQR